MKLASILITLVFGILASACQTTEHAGIDLAGQIATPTPLPRSTSTQPPRTTTAQPAFADPLKRTASALQDTPTAAPVIAPEVPIPSSTESVAIRSTSTPPPIAEGLPTPPTALPTAVATIAAPAAVTNIVLAGNDVRWPQGGRTDALIIVSINKETKKVALVSLPRDLYVYIPGWTMNRINLALPHGHAVDYPGGGGDLLTDTIEYNFGLSIDHYVRVGFDAFTQIVDTLDGIEVVVNCRITDWRLKSPELDPSVEENWERYTLEPGLHQMDGDLALWYARSRRSTNDFDRSRRQQQLARAILARGVDLGLVDDVPKLWNTFHESIETDLSLPEVISLAALAPMVNENGVQHLLLPADAFKAWRVPTTGEAVQLPQWGSAENIFEQLVNPPVLNRGDRPPLTAVVVTGDSILFRQAAENLNWHGIQAVHQVANDAPPLETQISYHHSTLKGSFHWLVAWLFGLQPEEIALKQDTDNPYDYHIVLGRDFNSCLVDELPEAPEITAR